MIKEEENEKIFTIIKIFIFTIEVIIIGVIAFIFFGVSKVNAAPIDYDSTGNYIHKNTPSEEWVNFPRATDYSLSSLATYSQVNIQWQNYQQGVANGIVQLKIVSNTLDTFTCNELYSKFRVLENGTNTNANITRNECSINTTTHEVRLKVGFVTSVLGTNSYLEVQFLQPFGLATSINALGVMTVNSLDPATNTDIQDQTNALIQNNNENTTNIINNMSLMQDFLGTKIQESQKYCSSKILKYSDGVTNGYIQYANGTISNANNWVVTDYLEINKLEIITIFNSSNVYSCFYDENKTLISCIPTNEPVGEYSLPTGTKYGRFSIRENQIPEYKVFYCQDRTQAETESIDNMNLTISTKLQEAFDMEEENAEEQKGLLQSIINGITGLFNILSDDDIDDPENSLNGLNNSLISDTPISSLLLLPVSIYQKVVNNINGTCSSINLGQLFNHDLIMTCIHIDDIIGTTLYSVIDVIISGFFILSIRKKIIEIFNNLTSLKTRRNELE